MLIRLLPEGCDLKVFYEPTSILLELIFVYEEEILVLLGGNFVTVVQKLDVKGLLKNIYQTLCKLYEISVVTLIIIWVVGHESLLAHVKLDLILRASHIIAGRIQRFLYVADQEIRFVFCLPMPRDLQYTTFRRLLCSQTNK